MTRDVLITGAALVLASALAWWWLARSGAAMDGMAMDHDMPGMAMPGRSTAWTPAYAASVFVMWAIMMVAMMLPSATPMILLHARVAGMQRSADAKPSPTAAFVGAYVAVWMAFSAAAAGTQWWLTSAGVVGDAMRFESRVAGGVLLIGAGLYQLTPLKRLCLTNCRTPLAFLIQQWHPGLRGALRMGLSHGAYCVGCCWFVMALLFVGGVMNLAWVVAIAGFVLAEKVLPFGAVVRIGAGVIAVAAGTAFVLTPLFTTG